MEKSSPRSMSHVDVKGEEWTLEEMRAWNEDLPWPFKQEYEDEILCLDESEEAASAIQVEVGGIHLGVPYVRNTSADMDDLWRQLVRDIIQDRRAALLSVNSMDDDDDDLAGQESDATPSRDETATTTTNHAYAVQGYDQSSDYEQQTLYDIGVPSTPSYGHAETRFEWFHAAAQAPIYEAIGHPMANVSQMPTNVESDSMFGVQYPPVQHPTPVREEGWRHRGDSHLVHRNRTSRSRPTPYTYSVPQEDLHTSGFPTYESGQPFGFESSATQLVNVPSTNEWQLVAPRPRLPLINCLDLSSLALSLPSQLSNSCALICMGCHETLQSVDGIPSQRDIIISILEAIHVIRPSWDVLSTALTFFKYLHYHDAWPRNFRYRSALDQVVFSIVHVLGTAPYNHAELLQNLLTQSLPDKDWTPVFATFYPSMFTCPFAPCEMSRHLRGLHGYSHFNGNTHRIVT